MQVRLAFSVAANLDPEILIVDEVLAVGDAAFQKKCLGKMGEVAESGRTVLFVSHNMKAIMNLCNRVIWLKNGKFNKSGDTRSITEDYLQDSLCAIENDDISEIIAKLPEDPSLKINHVAIVQNGKTKNHILSDRAFSIEIDYSILQNAKGIRIYFDLLDNDGTILIRSFNDEQAIHVPVIEPGNYFSKAIIPGNLLAPTNYELRIRGTIYNERSCTGDGIGIQIVVEDTSNLNRAYPNEPVRSKLRPIISWDNKKY